VVPVAEVLPTAMEIAGQIVANGPLAVRATREMVRLSSHDVAAAQARLTHWQPIIFGSEDAREGAAAFVEKRPAVWRNR
jgi:enoyl-CoA hydratase/carnithine racemase